MGIDVGRAKKIDPRTGNSVTVKYALDSETDFFKSHTQYRNISHRNGTKFLAKTLNQVRKNPRVASCFG